jgi:hypothetical protein
LVGFLIKINNFQFNWYTCWLLWNQTKNKIFWKDNLHIEKVDWAHPNTNMFPNIISRLAHLNGPKWEKTEYKTERHGKGERTYKQ